MSNIKEKMNDSIIRKELRNVYIPAWSKAKHEVYPVLRSFENVLDRELGIPLCDTVMVCYRVPIENPKGFLLVDQALLDVWGVTLDEVNAAAQQNADMCITKVLDETIITNKSWRDGAGVIVSPRNIARLVKEIGECYIIPSSIHELIVVSALRDAEDILKVVVDMNHKSGKVSKAEYLADAVFKCDATGLKVVAKRS